MPVLTSEEEISILDQIKDGGRNAAIQYVVTLKNTTTYNAIKAVDGLTAQNNLQVVPQTQEKQTSGGAIVFFTILGIIIIIAIAKCHG